MRARLILPVVAALGLAGSPSGPPAVGVATTVTVSEPVAAGPGPAVQVLAGRVAAVPAVTTVSAPATVTGSATDPAGSGTAPAGSAPDSPQQRLARALTSRDALGPAAAATAQAAALGPAPEQAGQRSALRSAPVGSAVEPGLVGRPLQAGDSRPAPARLVTSGLGQADVLATTPASTALLDGPQGTGTVGSAGASVTIGTVVEPAATQVAVTVLEVQGTPTIALGSTTVGVVTGSPYLVQVPAGSSPLVVSGAPGAAVRLAVRTLRTATASGTTPVDAHLQGAGDTVLVSWSLPSGAPGLALRLTAPAGRAAAVVDQTGDDTVNGVTVADQPAAGGATTTQGLPVETGATGTILLWAPEPLHRADVVDVQASLTVLAATLVSPAAGTTQTLSAPSTSPQVVRLPFSQPRPGSYTVLSDASGSLVPAGPPLGLPTTDATLRRTYLSEGTDLPVASFGGPGIYGPPTAVSLSFHLEPVRQVTQASATSLAALTVDQPGLVFDVTPSGLTADDYYEVDSGTASSVTMQVCYLPAGTLICQVHPRAQGVFGIALHAATEHVLLVPQADRPDGSGYADTGSWSWRLVGEQTTAGSVSTNVLPAGASSVQVRVPGLATSTGALRFVSCQAGGLGFLYREGENFTKGTTTATFHGGVSVNAGLPVDISASMTKDYAYPLGPYDGTDDGRGSSGVTLDSELDTPVTDVPMPVDPFVGAGPVITVNLSASTGADGSGVSFGSDATQVAAFISCGYVYVPAVT